ncbi:MAG: acyl carrier protein [Clostridia bacterium]|nr:acyl carrier protein [Clostridia bacterium]
MEKILNILQEIRSDIDFQNEKKLIDDGLLDSFDIIQIVSTFNDEFDIEIDVDELMPENFNSVEAMKQLIERLQEEA